MKSTGTKKPCPTTNQCKVLNVITKDVNNMSNITQFSQGKQVQISEHQLRRLLEFINTANLKFNEVQVLVDVIAEKAEEYSASQVLARLASNISLEFCDECLDELNFFKKNSPQLVSTFAEELVA